MANLLAPPILRRLRAFVPPDAAGIADADLLERYLTDSDEAAFESIVRRHGRMVLGACHRILGDPHDALDAFQATFLVLVRKAATVSPPEMLPAWLHGVARLTALRAREARRRRREVAVAAPPEPAAPRDDGAPDLRPVLDEELARLPAKYRVAVVTCDLEGLSHKQAAARLGWPMGTVASRLSRGRAALAKRLTRRGFSVPPTLVVSAPQLPCSLIEATLRAAELYAAGLAGSGPVIALTQGVLKAMLMSKLRSAVGVCVVAGLLALGGALALSTTGPDAVAAAPRPASKSLTLREAAIRTLRHAGFRVTEAGGELHVSYGAAVGLSLDPKYVAPTPLIAELIAAQALLNAEVAYWNLHGSRQQLAYRERALREARETLHTCESRRDAGRLSKADVTRARSQYETARVHRLKALDQVSEDERQLRYFAGYPLGNGPPLVPGDRPSVAAVQPDWDASVKEALAARAELKMARDQVLLSQSLLAGEKLIRMAMGLSPPSRTEASRRPHDLSGRLARDVEILKDQEQKVVRYLGNYYRRLSLNYEQIKAYRAQREAFEKQLQVLQRDFLDGRGALDILLEAQRFRTDAFSQEHATITRFNNALAVFDFAKGAALKRHKVTLKAGGQGGS